METYLVTSGTVSHAPIRTGFFEPSLAECEPVEWVHFEKRLPHDNTGNFMHIDWKHAVLWKIRNALKLCSMVDEGSLVVISDLDIIYRPGAFNRLSEEVSDGVFAMCENEQMEINAGLIASKNCQAFRWLLTEVLEYMVQHSCHDQNALRAVSQGRVKVLPVEYNNTKTENLIERGKALCFHAICTMADEKQGSVSKKLAMLQRWLDRCQSPMAT